MLAWLLREWRSRLAQLRRAVADPAEPRPWMALVQIRVLDYLIKRYGQEPMTEPAPPRVRTSAPVWPEPFSPMVEIDGPPPRSGTVIRDLLLDIHWRNQPARRWRFWP